MSRKRILVVINGLIAWRNFGRTGALAELEKNHHVTYLLASGTWELPEDKDTIRIAKDHVGYRTDVRYFLGWLSMRRYSGRSRTFPIKYRLCHYRGISLLQKLREAIFSLPGIYELYCQWREVCLSTLPEVDAAVAKHQPDFMIIPSGFSDSFSIDCLKAAKKHAVRHLMIMANWDNVSCKGVLSVLPQHLGVWGPQTQEQAHDIHRIPKKNIHLLGAPQFECHRTSPPQLGLQVRRQFDLPDNLHLMIFMGIARYCDEITILEGLERAITDGDLPTTHIVYRPHPWKTVYDGERNFFECGFKHITMDPELADHYRNQLTNPSYQMKDFVPDTHHARNFMIAADSVISPLTTMGVEAMLLGKPVLLLAFADPTHDFNVSHLYDYEHHQCWRRFRDALVCHQQSNLEERCVELQRVANDSKAGERVKEDIQYVVFNDEHPYSRRLCLLVDKLMET